MKVPESQLGSITLKGRFTTSSTRMLEKGGPTGHPMQSLRDGIDGTLVPFWLEGYLASLEKVFG